MDEKTINKWISVLNSSFIITTLYPFYNNFNKRITKSPKAYFCDTGILCSLLGIREENELINHPLKGSIFENHVILEFYKNNANFSLHKSFYYWAEHNGNEVDFVVPLQNKLLTFEIKSNQTFKTDFFKQLRKLEAYSNLVNHKNVIYNGDIEYNNEELQETVLNYASLKFPEILRPN